MFQNICVICAFVGYILNSLRSPRLCATIFYNRYLQLGYPYGVSSKNITVTESIVPLRTTVFYYRLLTIDYSLPLILRRFHPKFFLKTLGEITARSKSNLFGHFGHAKARLQQLRSLFQPHRSHKFRGRLSGYGR